MILCKNVSRPENPEDPEEPLHSHTGSSAYRNQSCNITTTALCSTGSTCELQLYLYVLLQLLPSLIVRFTAQLGPLTGELGQLQDLLELPVQHLELTVPPQNKVLPSIEQNLDPEELWNREMSVVGQVDEE